MYAIVDIAGQQVKVEKGQKILVHRLEGEKGSKVDFDKVMLITHNEKTAVGDPVIEGAQVQATILDHVKGDKVFVFKKKRRKGYKKLNGHRQYLSLLEIEEIIETGAKPKKETKKASPKATDKKEAEVEIKAEKAPEETAPSKAEKATEEVPAAGKAETKAPVTEAATPEVKDTEEKPKKTTRKKKTEEPEENPEA